MRHLSHSKPVGVAAVVTIGAGLTLLFVVPTGTLLIIVGLAGGCLVIAAVGEVETIFITVLCGLLALYAFLGRGIAHVGVPPVYLGEIALALGVAALSINITKVRLHPIQCFILAFMAWGVIRTAPFLGVYGTDALRDGAIWIYAAFAIVLSTQLQTSQVDRVLAWYRPLALLLVLWVPCAAAISLTWAAAIPQWPGAEVPLLVFKSGDFAVHLAGAATVVLLGADKAKGTHLEAAYRWLFWPLWFTGVAIVAAFNRGALLSVATGVLVVALLRPTRRLVRALLVGILMIVVVMTLNIQVDMGASRQLSVQQLEDNVLSAVSYDQNVNLEGTKQWRIQWWNKIVSYTITGPYLWTGKGFGVNLADEDGFQVAADHSLRAPHNSHLTILARAGVPGLFLWVSIQSAFLLLMLTARSRVRRMGQSDTMCVWVLTYWAAAMVNMTFDPYLESPQGGILFWSVLGLGIATSGHIRVLRIRCFDSSSRKSGPRYRMRVDIPRA